MGFNLAGSPTGEADYENIPISFPSSSTLSLRGKYVANACTRCKSLKVKCEADGTGLACGRCRGAGLDCIIPGRTPRRVPESTSRSPSPEPANSTYSHGLASASGPSARRSGACARCKKLKVKCYVDDDRWACRRCENTANDCFVGGDLRPVKSAHILSRIDSSEPWASGIPPASQISLSEEILNPLCVCNVCEIIDDGWLIQVGELGIKTFVHLTFSPLCPVCNSNTHQYPPSWKGLGNSPFDRLPTLPEYSPSPREVVLQTGLNELENSEYIVRSTSGPDPGAVKAFHGSVSDSFPQTYPNLDTLSPLYQETPHVHEPQLIAPGQPSGAPKSEVPNDEEATKVSIFTPCVSAATWILRQLQNTIMLWIPQYYEKQAHELVEVLKELESNCVDRWDGADNPNNELSLERGDQPDDVPTLSKLQPLWTEFVESRVFEYNILISATLVFIATSPTIFQIPSASDDRVIRTFGFLSISRAIAGFIFAIITNLHLRSPLSRNAFYIYSWFQDARASGWGLFELWVILSLPAVSSVWSLIQFIGAILAIMWRTDAMQEGVADISLPVSSGVYSKRPVIFSLRGCITFLFLVDLVYAVWAVRVLRRRTKLCLSRQTS